VGTVLAIVRAVAITWQPVDLTSDPDEVRYVGDPGDLLDVDDFLVELTRRPWWHSRAACAGMGVDRWFPGQGGDIEAALAVCAGCPVRADCLAAADAFGIWGGLSAKARKKHRRHAA